MCKYYPNNTRIYQGMTTIIIPIYYNSKLLFRKVKLRTWMNRNLYFYVKKVITVRNWSLQKVMKITWFILKEWILLCFLVHSMCTKQRMMNIQRTDGHAIIEEEAPEWVSCSKHLVPFLGTLAVPKKAPSTLVPNPRPYIQYTILVKYHIYHNRH